MKAIILQCPRAGQYHFGKVSPPDEENVGLSDTSTLLHADTLFSAIINTAAKMYAKDKVDKLIKRFEAGDWAFSSGFYCLQKGDKYLYFLPKPIHYNLLVEEEVGGTFDIKGLSKVEYISQKVWEQGILPKDWGQRCVVVQRKFVILREELAAFLGVSEQRAEEMASIIKIYSTHSVPKVAVHKEVLEDNLYYQTNLVVADNYHVDDTLFVHFYFLLNTKEIDDKEEININTVIDFLQYENIGGERSVGCGAIAGVNKENFQLNMSAQGDEQVTLSLVNPTAADVKSLMCYDIITRGGRKISRTEKDNEKDKDKCLKRVKMLREGALVSTKLEGRLPKLGESKSGIPFLRNGKPFILPIHPQTLPQNG